MLQKLQLIFYEWIQIKAMKCKLLELEVHTLDYLKQTNQDAHLRYREWNNSIFLIRNIDCYMFCVTAHTMMMLMEWTDGSELDNWGDETQI